MNLEPCSHFGKNAACASIIAAAGVGKVAFSHFDPDPDVRGKGLDALQAQDVSVSVGCEYEKAMAYNRLFLEIDWFLPRLFGGIHPTADPKEPPHVMLGLHVPRCEARSSDFGKNIRIHSFGVAPKRTTIRRIPRVGRPRIKPGTLATVPLRSETVLFTTLLNQGVQGWWRLSRLQGQGPVVGSLPSR